MNTSSLSRIIVGIAILAVGAGAFLGVIGLYDFGEVFSRWWPLLVILGGLLILVSDAHQYIWAGLAFIAGVLFLLERHDIIEFNVWQLFWPIIIMGVGLSILLNRSSRKIRSSGKEVTSISAILSGSDTKSHSQDYTGGNLSTFMGGVVLDLREAHIKDKATLNMFVLFGGVELKVPKGWNIQSNVTPILGGVESKTLEAPKANAPTLTITGDVIFGGVEIKH